MILDDLTSQGYRLTISDTGSAKLLIISRPGQPMRCADGTDAYCLHITGPTVEACAAEAMEALHVEVGHAAYHA